MRECKSPVRRMRMRPLRQDAQDMQLGFARCAFEAGAARIIEHRRMITPIGIADERVGETADIEQAGINRHCCARGRDTSRPSNNADISL
jgi:hypothetical protein